MGRKIKKVFHRNTWLVEIIYEIPFLRSIGMFGDNEKCFHTVTFGQGILWAVLKGNKIQLKMQLPSMRHKRREGRQAA
jgi:hypothetical protein